ncbi:PfkB family carbohydrate kinase [Escherichia coli]
MNKLAAQSPTVPVRWDRLGLNVVSVSCVGNDKLASIILDGFKKYHVNCDFVQVIPELIANTAIIFIDELGEKTLRFTRLVVIISGIKKKPCRQLRKAVIIIRCQQISRNFVCWPNIPVAR